MSTYTYKAISDLSIAEEILSDDILIISLKNIDNQLISKLMRMMDACNYISSNISLAIIDSLQTELNSKLNTSDRVDLSNYLTSDSHVPTCKSVVEWCNLNFLKSVGFEDPTEVITMLLSMMSESDMVCYVDLINGNDTTHDGSIDKPFKTIYKAVQTANKRRFIGNSLCYIYLKSDIRITVSDDGRSVGEYINGKLVPVTLYHPDLVLTKYMYLKSYDIYNPRTIKCDTKAITTYYRTILMTNCNVSIEYVNFDCEIPLDKNFNDSVFSKSSYCIYNRSDCVNELKLNFVTISNCMWGVLCASLISRCNFIRCKNPVYVVNNSQTVVEGGIVFDRCLEAFSVAEASNLMFNNISPFPTIIKTYNKPISIRDGSIATMVFCSQSILNNGYWSKDTNGYIDSDEPNEGYENCYVKIGHIDWDTDEITEIKYSTIGEFCESIFNINFTFSSSGDGMYTLNGYISSPGFINTKKLLTYGENFDWNGNTIQS